MQDFHHGFTEARQMNMEVNWLQAAERFITSLLELRFSLLVLAYFWEKVQLTTEHHILQKVRNSRTKSDKLKKKTPSRDTKYKDPNSGSEGLRIQSIFPKNYHYLPALFLHFSPTVYHWPLFQRYLPWTDLLSGPVWSLVCSLCCISKQVLWGLPWQCYLILVPSISGNASTHT